jgi:hypothetical protein
MKPSSTCLNETSSLIFSQQSAQMPSGKLTKQCPVTQYSCLLFLFLFLFPSPLVCVLVDFSFFPFSFSNSLAHLQSKFSIGPDRAFLSSSSHNSFFDNSPIPDVLRSNALLKLNWGRLFHNLNSASQSHTVNVTAQEGRNASPAMNEVLTATTTNDRFVPLKAEVSMCVKSESVSNEIDEIDSQHEKHDEQRI